MTLTDFLLARIADDESLAKEAPNRIFLHRTGDEVLYDPDRVLAECAAKRRIVALFTHGENYGVVLRLLALPHANHPDYREEWRP